MNYASIILSGQPVSGKSALAKRLSEIYKWPVHSPGQLWRDEWRRLYPSGEISFEDFWRNTTTEDNLRMDQRAREIFEKGGVIGDTRYSIYCTDLPALLVLITADLDVRVQRALGIDRYRNKSLEEVRQTLIEREKDEVRVGQSLYGIDYDYRDPKYYHLTLNSGLLTLDEEISTLVNVAPSHPPLKL